MVAFRSRPYNTGGQQTRRKEGKSWFTGEIFLQSRDVSPRQEGGLIERSKGGEGDGSTKWSTIIRSAGENADVPFLIYPRALMSANLRQLNFLAETSPHPLEENRFHGERCSFSTSSRGWFLTRGGKRVPDRENSFRSRFSIEYTTRNLWPRMFSFQFIQLLCFV